MQSTSKIIISKNQPVNKVGYKRWNKKYQNINYNKVQFHNDFKKMNYVGGWFKVSKKNGYITPLF